MEVPSMHVQKEKKKVLIH